MMKLSPFTSDQLAARGRALYGDRWQSPLARELHVSDRTMRRWLADDVPIPRGIEDDLRAVLRKHLETIGGLVPYVVNSHDHTIFHSVKYCAFRYDDADNVTLLHPGLAAPEQVSLIAEGAKEALLQERERDPRVKFKWVDTATGRTEVDRSLHGFMQGTVIIPPEVDLTAPIIDEPFDAETGELP